MDWIGEITEFHHLHIWSLGTTETALTVHLVKPRMEGDDELLETVSYDLKARFGIDHATIQFERPTRLRRRWSMGLLAILSRPRSRRRPSICSGAEIQRVSLFTFSRREALQVGP